MTNRAKLYNTDKNNELHEIATASNRIPSIWCLLFTIDNFNLSPSFFDEISYNEEKPYEARLVCTIIDAKKNLKEKAIIAQEKGVPKEIIERLEYVLNLFKYKFLMVDLTEYAHFFSSEVEMRDALIRTLLLDDAQSEYPSQTNAIDLADIYETLNLPIPETINQLKTQPIKLEVKARISTANPIDNQGRLLAEYFTRHGFNEIYFNEENDHNPLVRHACAKCNGNGFIRVYDPPLGDLSCDACYGSTCEDKLRPMFQPLNDQKISRKVNEYGYVRCPGCNKIFSISDTKRWTGLRHRCGQKITLELL